MATQTFITYECDGCGKESGDDLAVEPHTVQIDGHKVIEVDACEKCWDKGTGAMEKLLTKGRYQSSGRPVGVRAARR